MTFRVQNKCALYWSEEDATTDKYNIYQGTITVTLANKVTEKSYVKRVFEVVKQQVRITYLGTGTQVA